MQIKVQCRWRSFLEPVAQFWRWRDRPERSRGEIGRIETAEYAAQVVNIYGDILIFDYADGSAFRWCQNRAKDGNP